MISESQIIIDNGGFPLHYILKLINSNIPHLSTFDFDTLKKLHGMGTDRHTDRRTSQLLDRIGTVGRFGENVSKMFKYSLFMFLGLPVSCDKNKTKKLREN